jgi:phage baseplate assembly protein W
VNIDYPFHIDGLGRTATTDDNDHIRDMIEQFLFTSPFERVNRPDFGGGLLRLPFEPNSPELATALEHTIRAGLQRWLGDLIEVRRLSVTSEDSTIRVIVNYVVRRTNEEETRQFAAARV